MSAISLFEEKQVRRAWDAENEKWLFAIVDVVAILTESVDAGAYWRKLKERLKKEGNETVTDCHGLKMIAADGKQRMTDVADTEQIFRLIQSIPSPKAEPFKEFKALSNPKDNLRDHMTDLELIFTMLGEASTTEIAKRRDAQGFSKNKQAAKDGGSVAGDARRDLESKSGKRISTRDNFKALPESLKRLESTDAS